MNGYQADKHQLWVEIELGPKPEDRIELELVQGSGQNALNDIPKCSLTVALGRRLKDNKASAIHSILDRLKVKRRVIVWGQSKTFGRAGPAAPAGAGAPPWPQHKFMVFDGYTTGAGYARSGGSASYTLECEHWLADLAAAPATSAASSPKNPAQMTFTALTASPSESVSGTTQMSHMTGITTAQSFITAETVQTDFWGDALQPFLRALSGMETLVDSHPATQISLDLGPVPPGNLAAQQALDRFEPTIADQAEAAGAPPGVGEAAKLSVPLAMDPAAYGGDMANVADQITLAIGSETLEVMSGSTVWDKLVQYAGTYLFAIVPLPTRALVVPFVPGLRETFKTVLAGEYDFVRLNGDMPRILRGVGVYGGKDFEANAALPSDDAVDYDRFSIGGYFQGASTGQILFQQAPMWMASYGMSSGVDRSGGAGGHPIADAHTPGAGLPPVGPTPAAMLAANARLMDKYAEALYAYEILKFRSGDLSGHLRFDIGPGSSIKLECAGEKFLGVDDKFGQTLYATVLQTSWFYDAEGPKSGTSFHLAHVRNELENKTAGFSVDRHPIWKNAWPGCPLIQF